MNRITKKVGMVLIGSFILGACQPKTLVDAVKAGDPVAVQTFLSKGADVDAKDEKGTPVLVIAAQQGDEDIVRYLLQAGADVNNKDVNGNTALISATQADHINVVIDLLNANANLYDANNEGKSALMLVGPEQVRMRMLFGEETLYIIEAIEKYHITNGMMPKAKTLNAKIRNFYKAVCDSFETFREGGKPEVSDRLCDYSIDHTWERKTLPDGLFEFTKEVQHWVIDDIETLKMRRTITVYSYIVDINQKTISGKDTWACGLLNVPVAADLIRKEKRGESVDCVQECKFPIKLQEEAESTKKEWRDNYRTNSKRYVQLLEAIRKGNIKETKRLIVEGVDVNEKDKTLSKRNCEGCTPLLFASQWGKSKIIPVLLDAGAKIEETEKRFLDTALMLAVLEQHVDAVKTLLEAKANVSHRNKLGYTALIIASQKGNAEIVKALLAAGANTEDKDPDGLTPLLWASQKGHAEVVQILLEAGADATVQGESKERKKEHQGPTTALQYAISQGHTDVINAFLRTGVSIDEQNQYGQTALMRFAANGDVNKVKILLALGADVNLEDKTQKTALSYAANPEIAKTLLDAGANFKTEDCMDHILTSATDSTFLASLFEKGCRVNDTDKYGNTALFYASRGGKVESVKALLAAGANVDKRSNQKYREMSYTYTSFINDKSHTYTEELGGAGWTALMAASLNGKTEIVKILLDAGADVNNRSENGWTALMAASLGNYPDVVRLLIANKANVHYKNKKRDTALALSLKYHSRLFGGNGVAALLEQAGAR